MVGRRNLSQTLANDINKLLSRSSEIRDSAYKGRNAGRRSRQYLISQNSEIKKINEDMIKIRKLGDRTLKSQQLQLINQEIEKLNSDIPNMDQEVEFISVELSKIKNNLKSMNYLREKLRNIKRRLSDTDRKSK